MNERGRPPRNFNSPVKRSDRLLSSIDEFLELIPELGENCDPSYLSQPASLEDWLYFPEYMNLGDTRLSKIQYDFINSMDDINPKTNPTEEVVGLWGKGSGKDFICALAALRKIYKLLLLKNPYGYYGLVKGTGMQLVNVAYTKDQAKYVYFKQVRGLLLGSPWFVKQNPEIQTSRIKFKHEIELVSTSADGDSAEGQNIFFAVMDEASAFKDSAMVKSMRRADGVKVDRAADAIYYVLRTSINSRFPGAGILAIISYPRYKGDFTEQKAEENREGGRGYVSGPYATWEVNPLRKRSDFDEDYRKAPEKAAAMYECKAQYAEDSYVAFPQRFIDCVIESMKIPDLRSPIDENGAYEPMWRGMPGRLYAIHVDLGLKKDRCALALARQGEFVTRIKCPCNHVSSHLWQAEVCAGCGRPQERWIKVELPTMVVTLLKAFKPKKNALGAAEVDFSDVREEILWIRERGHKIWALSYDGWQSVDSIQTMRKLLGSRQVKDRWGKEIRTEEICNTLSVDRNTEAYDTLKEFIYDGRFFITPPLGVTKASQWEDKESKEPVVIAYQEWRALRIINAKKVDHMIGNSKDFCDALAGTAYWISKMPMHRSRVPRISGWAERPVSSRN